MNLSRSILNNKRGNPDVRAIGNGARQRDGKFRRHPPQKCAFRGGPGPHLIRSSLGPPQSTSKRHLDRFSRFCWVHKRDTQTDRRRYSICSNRLHLTSAAMRPNNNNDNNTCNNGDMLYRKLYAN